MRPVVRPRPVAAGEDEKPGGRPFEYEYIPPRSAALQPVYQRVREYDLLHRMPEVQMIDGLFLLPRTLRFVTAECGEIGAFYVPESDEVVLCYETLKVLYERGQQLGDAQADEDQADEDQADGEQAHEEQAHEDQAHEDQAHETPTDQEQVDQDLADDSSADASPAEVAQAEAVQIDADRVDTGQADTGQARLEQANTEPAGAEPEHDQDFAQRYTSANLRFIVLHETGHALINLLDLPVTGRQEDAVDQLATMLMMNFASVDESPQKVAEDLRMAANWFLVRSTGAYNIDAYADEHSLGEQRYFSLQCLLYGSDPARLVTIVSDGDLPPARAQRCPEEAKQVQRSWLRLLLPHLAPKYEMTEAEATRYFEQQQRERERKGQRPYVRGDADLP